MVFNHAMKEFNFDSGCQWTGASEFHGCLQPRFKQYFGKRMARWDNLFNLFFLLEIPCDMKILLRYFDKFVSYEMKFN